jgi:hypothetical protein
LGVGDFGGDADFAARGEVAFGMGTSKETRCHPSSGELGVVLEGLGVAFPGIAAVAEVVIPVAPVVGAVVAELEVAEAFGVGIGVW